MDGSEAEAMFTYTERNIGKCRDLAAKRSTGDVILSASTDVYYPPETIEKLEDAFKDELVIAVSGRIHPTGCGVTHHLAYGFMECFRRLTGLKKPSASLYAIRRNILDAVGGYPHVRIAEGELLGELVEKYARLNGFKTIHRGDIYGIHHVKSGERSPLFYLYLFIPQLKNIQGRKFSDK